MFYMFLTDITKRYINLALSNFIRVDSRTDET